MKSERRLDVVPGLPLRITLLTDFGTADGYTGAVHGVIAARAPGIRVDDIGHDIPPGNVAAAAAALARYWMEYPTGTVHVVVVDPGVGSGRRALLVAAAGRVGIGPDNGVLTAMLESSQFEEVREIRNSSLFREPVSPTFHGRDVFAPVAAWIAQGGRSADVGPLAADPVRLHETVPVAAGAAVRGVVTGSDRFGNLSTNVPATSVPLGADIRIDGRSVGPLLQTYSDVAPGEPLALIGSDGRLEIAVRGASAATLLRAGPGSVVEVGSRPGAND